MAKLNWKDSNDGKSSGARASRAVRGEYRVFYRPSYTNWRDEIIEAFYEVEYRRNSRWDWNDVDIPSLCGWPRSLAEAKQRAEEDCERRQREAQQQAEL
jgi:hypothetical protein